MRYHRSLDHMILAVEFAQKGKPRKAAAALDKVLEDPGTDRALAALSRQQDRAFRETARGGRRMSKEEMRRARRFVGEAVIESDSDDDYGDERLMAHFTAGGKGKKKGKARRKLDKRIKRNIESLG